MANSIFKNENLTCIFLSLFLCAQSVSAVQTDGQSHKGTQWANSALKIQCRIVRNTLPQTAFSANLSTGYIVETYFVVVSNKKLGCYFCVKNVY